MPSPTATVHVPDASSYTADGDLRAEAHVAPQVEPVDDVVEVALGLRLFGEVLLPLPLVEQLLREQVRVRVALGVEPRAGVAVPVPGAADAAAGLEQLHREAGFARAVQLVDAGDAGADDQHVDVGDRRGRDDSMRPRIVPTGRVDIVATWRSWIRSGRRSRCRSRWSSPTASRKERYYDPDFYAMEAELLWPRVWQMACRLEEIPQPHDFVEYEFLDQSVIVLRTDDMGVRAFQNACRHRGVKVVEGRGHVRERVHLPVPRLVLRPRRQEHARPAAQDVRRAQPAARRHRPRAGAVRDVGRVRVDQPRRRRAAAAAVHRAVRDDPRRVEGRVAADRVVVRVPAPRELEARAKRRSSSSTTWSRRTRSSSSPAGTRRATARRSTRGRSSTPTSTTCAR